VVRSDDDLLAAWRAGDQYAGKQLYSRHFPRVRCYFANKVDELSDVEDLVQETFMACYEAADRYAARATFVAYLLGIARHKLLEFWRKQTQGRVDDIEAHSLASLGAGPSSILAHFEEGQRLLAALRELEFHEQELLELYYWEKLTGRELGEVLGVGEDTARSRLFRAKGALREKLRRLDGSGTQDLPTDEDLDGWAERIHARLKAPDREPSG
jgi:RNA polymerase sigma factor (sigma-70 family)